MNRRGFLGAMLAAPMAAPSIVKAAAAEATKARWGNMALYGLGERVSDHTISLKVNVDTSAARAALEKMQMNISEQTHGYSSDESIRNCTCDPTDAPPIPCTRQYALTECRACPPLAPTDRKGDWMQTASGRQFYPLDPRPEEIHIEDIAAALSKLCRYGGHAKEFYSVAEHCVLMAQAAPEGLQLAALLHDASEAYLSDVIRPIKKHLVNYQAIEAELERAIAQRFVLPYPMPAEVKRLDDAILADERDQVMAPPPADWQLSHEPIGVTIQFWSPQKAEFEFLAAFRRYGGHWC